MLRKIFFSKEYGVRLVWKFLMIYSISLLGGILFTGLFNELIGLYVLLVYNQLPEWVSITNNTVNSMVTEFGLQLILLFTVFMIAKKVDRISIKDNVFVIRKNEIGEFLWGCLLGALAIMAVVMIGVWTGTIAIKVSAYGQENITLLWQNIIYGLFFFLMVSMAEEVFARGYILNDLNRKMGTVRALVISSVIFSFLHLSNPHIGLIGIINIFLAGILFGYAYLVTESLWMPIGIHLMWNYFQGYIFSLPVSGIEMRGIFKISDLGPEMITGGQFGPEGGLIATGVLVVMILLLKSFWAKSKMSKDIGAEGCLEEGVN